MGNRFSVDGNDDEFYVYDDDIMYCHAGPMKEEEACSMAAELNNLEEHG